MTEPAHTDLAYAFTLFFATLGPIKTIPTFFVLTRGADRRTVLRLATRSTLAGTLLHDSSRQAQLVGLLLVTMAADFVAMLVAHPIMRHWAAFGLAGAVGPPLMGRVFDTTGSYSVALVALVFTTLAAGLSLLALPAVTLLRSSRPS